MPGRSRTSCRSNGRALRRGAEPTERSHGPLASTRCTGSPSASAASEAAPRKSRRLTSCVMGCSLAVGRPLYIAAPAARPYVTPPSDGGTLHPRTSPSPIHLIGHDPISLATPTHMRYRIRPAATAIFAALTLAACSERGPVAPTALPATRLDVAAAAL